MEGKEEFPSPHKVATILSLCALAGSYDRLIKGGVSA